MKPSIQLANIKCLFKGNKLLVYGIKYIPIICTILLTLREALRLLGVYEPITASLAIILNVVLLILLSIRFSFCKLHKAMIIYMALMTLCICIQKYDVFGEAVRFVQLGLFAIGVGLVSLAIFKKCNDDCGE